MSTRPATSEEERLVMAIHEAGHLVATHTSCYFGLREPAVQINLDGPFSALSGATRVRDTTAPEHHLPSTREYVRIAFAGKAAEQEFLRRQPQNSPRLIPNPDGADFDLSTANKTLAAMGIDHEREQLWQDALETVQQHWQLIQKVAELIYTSQAPTIDRAELLAVLPPKI